jgi:iron complex outermembrane receptor protein
VTLTAALAASRLAVDLLNRRFGRTAYVDATRNALDQTFHAKWITDVSASYRLSTTLRAAVTVSNLLDVYPDDWSDFSQGKAGVISFGGTVRYPAGHSPFGVNGRTVYFHLSYRGN